MKVFPLSRRTLIACILALATTAILAGQELPGSIKGFKKQTLEVYFNRADLERESSAWERVARFGAEAAVSLWEREASDLYTDPVEIAQARAQLTGWVGTQVQERYEAWLTRRFFDRQGSLGSEAVLRAITGADLQYLYTTDDSGNIVLDESGDPVLRGATGLEADRAGAGGFCDRRGSCRVGIQGGCGLRARIGRSPGTRGAGEIRGIQGKPRGRSAA
jgi:hypothetical protein